MAGPGGREVGRISIRVLPDTSRFGPELKAYLETTERRMRLDLPVSLDQKDVAKVEAQLGLLTRDRRVDIDTNAMVSSIDSATQLGAQRFARMAGAIAGVSVALGVLVAALPGALAILGAPLAAAIIGWDGVKEAAKGVSKEVEHLKKALETTFETGMTPIFKRLALVFPVLEAGLEGVAESVIGIFGKITKALTSEGGLAHLESIFANIKAFFDGVAPAAKPFIDSLLILADAGAKIAVAMTPEFVQLFKDFNSELLKMSQNGDLQKGMEGISHAIYLIVATLGALVLGGIALMAELERFGEGVHNFATVTLPREWAALVASTQAAWASFVETIKGGGNAAVDYVLALPFRIVEALASLPGQLASLGARAGSAFLSAITAPFTAAIALGARTVSSIVSAISGLASKLGGLGSNAAGSFLKGLTGPFAAAIALAKSVAEKIASTMAGALKSKSPSKVMIALGEGVGEGLQIGMERSLAGVTGAALELANAPIRASSVTRLVNETGPAAQSQSQFYLKSGKLIIEGGDAMVEGVLNRQLVAALP